MTNRTGIPVMEQSCCGNGLILALLLLSIVLEICTTSLKCALLPQKQRLEKLKVESEKLQQQLSRLGEELSIAKRLVRPFSLLCPLCIIDLHRPYL